jgi:hypothetical protein
VRDEYARRVRTAFVLVLSAQAVLGLSVYGNAQAGAASPSQTFTLIDRTMVCLTAFEGGVPDRVRTLSVGVTPKNAQFEAFFNLSSGGGPLAPLVSVETGETAGRPPAVLVNRRRCTRVKKRLEIGRQGRSAPATQLGDSCELLDAPQRTVVRLRALMESPTRWTVSSDRRFLRARGKALEALLVVRAHPRGTPLVFTSIDRAGSARFSAAPRCVRG